MRDHGRLSQRPSGRFPVHRCNRRARVDSAALTGDETRQTDLDDALAFAVLGVAFNRDAAAAEMPLGVQKAIARGFLLTSCRKQMVDLLPTIAPEIHRILDDEGPVSDYVGITARVLRLVAGQASDDDGCAVGHEMR